MTTRSGSRIGAALVVLFAMNTALYALAPALLADPRSGVYRLFPEEDQ